MTERITWGAVLRLWPFLLLAACAEVGWQGWRRWRRYRFELWMRRQLAEV